MNTNVLVVGGAGYIGSHTTLALEEAGFNAIVYDNFSTGYSDACFGTSMVVGDLHDKTKLVQTIEEYDITSIIHFAALIEAGQSVVTPIPFFQNNVAGTICLLEAMVETDVRNLIFSSTAAVYGNQPGEALLTETLPIQPINPYGESKAMVETILRSAADAYGLQSIALRYFNASGADPLLRTGERHQPETHLIPLVMEAAIGKRENIKIFGTDYPTDDGTCIRDYIHVSDLAKGHVAALYKLLGSNGAFGFKSYNLGTGKGYSVRKVIDTVRDVSGLDFDVVEVARREGDPASLIADAREANSALNWKPEKSNIENIVKDAWNYLQVTSQF